MKAKSSIVFKVEEKTKDEIKARLETTLLDIATNKLLGKSLLVRYPEYNPVDVREE